METLNCFPLDNSTVSYIIETVETVEAAVGAGETRAIAFAFQLSHVLVTIATCLSRR